MWHCQGPRQRIRSRSIQVLATCAADKFVKVFEVPGGKFVPLTNATQIPKNAITARTTHTSAMRPSYASPDVVGRGLTRS